MRPFSPFLTIPPLVFFAVFGVAENAQSAFGPRGQSQRGKRVSRGFPAAKFLSKCCKAIRPGSALFLLSLAFSLVSCGEKSPVIDSIDPRIGAAGETLIIRGTYFGAEREESYITIAGTPPTSSSYVFWRDDQISVKIPEFVEAGMVFVHRAGRKSNPVLFSLRDSIPVPGERIEGGGGPRITKLEPSGGAIGSLVTIQGSGFGAARENGTVCFAWDSRIVSTAPLVTQAPEMVEVSAEEFGYELWSEREIRVRVPDGAVSGNLVVRTGRGESRPVYFEVNGKPGTKIFRDKRIYTISYSVDIQVLEAALPNALYLWIPKPTLTPSQRKVELLYRNREPFVDDYRGTSLFQLLNLQSGGKTGITQSSVVEVYAVETTVKNPETRRNKNSPVYSAYTMISALVPSGEGDILALAGKIVGREQNPYLKARKIYRWILDEINIKAGSLSGGAWEALRGREADSYGASLLFCALARAAGLPARPVAGILVNRLWETSRHCWAEFWIDGFGWVPLDAALGAGVSPRDFNLREDREDYYFGNTDNQRIIFSRGQITLSQIEVRGRTVPRQRDYALQDLWEEATGGLESYSSLWGDVTITGVYAQ